LRPVGDLEYYPKTEVKNLNSFKAVEKALIHEIQRQKELWAKDDVPKTAETRGWDDKKGETVPQRNKETLNDYRFFPEPDLPILELNDELISEIEKEIKNLPWKTRARLLEEYAFGNDTITQLLENQDLLNYLENVISELMDWMNSEKAEYEIEELAKLASNWIINKLPPLLNKSEQNWGSMALSGENMAELLKMIHKNEINNQQGQQFLEKMILAKKDVDPSHLLDEIQADKKDFDLEKLVEEVLNDNPDEVKKYLGGKTELLRFFLGQIMKLSKGQADPAETEKILKDKLK
jgi:aspartyl-tRNA(Asn)/glutamyl-tRNA(Gln) amidotransferase subunit B